MSAEACALRHLRQAGGFFSVGPRTRIRVTGTDRLRYLNGQMSNDLRRLESGSAMSALVLTAKGKLCADVFVWGEPDAVVVEADASLGETLLARLERYAVADDVAFEMLPRDDGRQHVFGPAAGSCEGLRIRRLGVEGVDVFSEPSGLASASTGEIELLRIERGLPRWGYELSEDILPQEAALDRVAVDFQKGCYVGQEVVSRIESVGRVNRSLCGFLVEGDLLPRPPLSLAGSEGRVAGELTSAAFHPELEKIAALGYLSAREAADIFSVIDETGACLGRAERCQFPLVS